jgi:methyl-accepting chemotaxis protein
MAFFKHLRIRNKLFLSFLTVIVLGAAALALNVYYMLGVRTSTDLMVKETQKMTALREFQSVYSGVEMYERSYLLSGNEEFLEKREQSEGQAKALLEKALSLAHDEEKEEFSKLQEMMEGEEEFPRVVALYQAGKKKEAMALTQELYGEVLDEADEQIGTIIANAQVLLDQINAQTQRLVHKTVATGIIVSLAALALSLILAVILAGSITKPIAHLRNVAEKVSLGDLSIKVKVDQRNEIGELGDSFERMVTAVRFFAMPDEEPQESQSGKEGPK